MDTGIAPFNGIDVIATLAGLTWIFSSQNDAEKILRGYDLIPKKMRLRMLTEEERQRISTEFSSAAKRAARASVKKDGK